MLMEDVDMLSAVETLMKNCDTILLAAGCVSAGLSA
jgi:hypothetical protein